LTFIGRARGGLVTDNGRMKYLRWFTPILLAALATAAPPGYEKSLITGSVKPKSFSRLAFGPDGILFVGDSIGARVFALDLDDKTPAEVSKPLTVNDLEGKIAGMLGADPWDVMIHDMAVNPISKNTYLTVSRGRRAFTQDFELPNDVASASALLRVTLAGEIQEVRLDKVKHSFVDVSNPVNETAQAQWKKAKQRVDAISDMAFADGKLYVSGLSNEEFSSTMRIYSFPFDGTGSATSLEIYHGSHGRYETDSPVRAFLPVKIQGKQYLLAAYLCTPLAVFPVDSLKDKSHVKGTTIAELGSGNYPLDMVAFRWQGKDRIWVVNTARGQLMFNLEDLEKPLPSITTPIEGTAGVPFEHLKSRGVLQAKNFGDKNLLLLVRDLMTGSLNLQTMPFDRM
jgi:hypothetical protein